MGREDKRQLWRVQRVAFSLHKSELKGAYAMDSDCLLPPTAEQCWSRHLRAQEAFSLLKTCLLPIARLSKSKCYCHVVSIMCLQWAAHSELSAVVHMSPLVKNWQTCHALQTRCSWNVKIIIQLEVKLLTELKMSNFHDIKPAIPVAMTYLDEVTLQGIYQWWAKYTDQVLE